MSKYYAVSITFNCPDGVCIVIDRQVYAQAGFARMVQQQQPAAAVSLLVTFQGLSFSCR